MGASFHPWSSTRGTCIGRASILTVPFICTACVASGVCLWCGRFCGAAAVAAAVVAAAAVAAVVAATAAAVAAAAVVAAAVVVAAAAAVFAVAAAAAVFAVAAAAAVFAVAAAVSARVLEKRHGRQYKGLGQKLGAVTIGMEVASTVTLADTRPLSPTCTLQVCTGMEDPDIACSLLSMMNCFRRPSVQSGEMLPT